MRIAGTGDGARPAQLFRPALLLAGRIGQAGGERTTCDIGFLARKGPGRRKGKALKNQRKPPNHRETERAPIHPWPTLSGVKGILSLCQRRQWTGHTFPDGVKQI